MSRIAGRVIDRRRFVVATGALGLVAACASTRTRTGGANAPTLELGVLLPRSGYLASSGDLCSRGIQAALRLAPELGFKPIRVIERDTGETVQSALEAAELAIAAGANMLLGCYDSEQTMAVATVAERRRVPLIINVGAAPSIMQQGYRYIFRNFPEATRIVEDSYRLQKEIFARGAFVPRRVAVLYINNGRGIEGISSQFSQMHMPYELATPIPYDPKSTDLGAYVAQARATGADALWTVSRLDDAIRITQELVRLNWTPGLLMSSNAGLFEPAYVTALGRNADYGITFAPFYDPNKRLTQRLIKALARTPAAPALGTLETYSFEAALIALDAHRRAQSNDAEQLATALRATDLRDNVTPGSGVKFDSRGQNTGLHLVAIQTRAGRARVVAPLAAAELPPVSPMPPWESR